MKLRNKKTGETVYVDFQIPLVNNNKVLGAYSVTSLKELNESFEDYTPQEPLIEDEKIRKAVRAWVNANRWTDDVRLEFNDFGYHESWSLEQHTDNNEIHFSGRMPNCMHKQLYAITELCGEEE